MAHVSEQDLENKIISAKQKVKVGGKYVHYKKPNDPYIVIDIAIIESTENPCVVYKNLANKNLTWVREIDDFLAEIELNNEKVSRFTLVQ